MTHACAIRSVDGASRYRKGPFAISVVGCTGAKTEGVHLCGLLDGNTESSGAFELVSVVVDVFNHQRKAILRAGRLVTESYDSRARRREGQRVFDCHGGIILKRHVTVRGAYIERVCNGLFNCLREIPPFSITLKP